MTDLRKAAEMALEALEWNYGTDLCDIENCMAWLDKMNATIPALRQALAQPEQEPVAWMHIEKYEIVSFETDKEECEKCEHCVPLYTAPPKREWVGLTDAEVEAWRGNYDFFDSALVREVEAKLKEKNA